MSSTRQFLYRYIPSFKRESGVSYNLYVAVYSRIYTARMRHLHRRGRHGALMASGPCHWCGAVVQPQEQPCPRS